MIFRKLEQPLRVKQVSEMEHRRIEIPVFPRVENLGELLKWERSKGDLLILHIKERQL